MSGHYATLLMVLGLLLTKYTLAYFKMVDPTAARVYLLLDAGVSALGSGYFLGKGLSYIYRWKVAS